MAHRIVLTGGPGAGKSTAADLIRRELGDQIVVVPEAATLLFGGGFPRVEEKHAQRSAQLAIYHTQRNMEDAQQACYPDRTLLCDRGTIDGAAYWPNTDVDFFEALGTTVEEELKRYDAVVFFESAAVGNISIEGGNPVRVEDNKRAVELDAALRDLWSKHSNFKLVKHQASFLKKINCAIECINETLKGL